MVREKGKKEEKREKEKRGNRIRWKANDRRKNEETGSSVPWRSSSQKPDTNESKEFHVDEKRVDPCGQGFCLISGRFFSCLLWLALDRGRRRKILVGAGVLDTARGGGDISDYSAGRRAAGKTDAGEALSG